MSTYVPNDVARQLAARRIGGRRPDRYSLIALIAASFALGLIAGRLIQ